jgi:tagatose 1,6-diphosphate aldolase GatY/KbaY
MTTAFERLFVDRASQAAVGAFTCYDLETAAAVLRAAERRSTPVILLIGARSFAAKDGPRLLSALVAAAAGSDVGACVQLDHCSDLDQIGAALELGAGAVMADASKLDFEANVAFVQSAVARAAAFGAGVEAELGGISGDEDAARAVEAGALTDPDQAREFVQRTGVHCLAVSIGNVHGLYREPPQLDWGRLDGIAARVSRPLALHGASGIPYAMVRRSIAAGIAKINVNTELRQAYLEATRKHLPALIAEAQLADLHDAQTAAVERVVDAKLEVYAPGTGA